MSDAAPETQPPVSAKLQRIREEYKTWPVFIGAAANEEKALDTGAFDAFDLATVTPGDIHRCLRHMERQIDLEDALEKAGVFED